jgi:hypothetical protein
LKISLHIVSVCMSLFMVWTLSASPAFASIQPTTLFPVIEHYPGTALGSSILAQSGTAQDAELNQIVATGISWVRFDFEWKNVQPQNNGQYNWTALDAFVAKVNTHHVNILGVIDYAPAWAAGPCALGTNCPPASPALFATYAAAVAQHFTSQGVSKWEIWNEPNNAFFWGSTSNCSAYAADLKAAYVAIKRVNPAAGVISGGLSPASTDGSNMSPTDFLSCIYTSGAGGYFDAVGDHPYTYPFLPSANNLDAWAEMSQTSPSLRSIMVENGDANKRIWITEFGAPTNGPDPDSYVNEWVQNSMMTDAINQYMSYPWAGPFFWYTFADSGTSTSTIENFFGLLRFDGSEKPAYMTYMWAIKAGI